MNFKKYLLLFFLLFIILFVSIAQKAVTVDSFYVSLDSRCSKNAIIKYWDKDLYIFDYTNGIIFKTDSSNSIIPFINYKKYSDSLNQSSAKFGMILLKDSVGLINLKGTEISYFSFGGDFGNHVKFEETSGRHGSFVDNKSLVEYINQPLKFPLFIPLDTYLHFPLLTGKFGRACKKYYSKRKLIGKFNKNGKLEYSFAYYDSIYLKNTYLMYIDNVSFYSDYKNNRVFVGQEASPIIQVYNFEGDLLKVFGNTPLLIKDWEFNVVSNVSELHAFELSYRIASPIFSKIMYEPENNLIFRTCLLPAIDTTIIANNNKINNEEKNSCGVIDPKTETRREIYFNKPVLLQIYDGKSYELINEYYPSTNFLIIGIDDKYIYVKKEYRTEDNSFLIQKYLISDLIKL